MTFVSLRCLNWNSYSLQQVVHRKLLGLKPNFSVKSDIDVVSVNSVDDKLNF